MFRQIAPVPSMYLNYCMVQVTMAYFNKMEHGIRKENQVHTSTSDHLIELSQEHVQPLSQLVEVGHWLIHFGQFHVCILSLLSCRLRGVSAQQQIPVQAKEVTNCY